MSRNCMRPGCDRPATTRLSYDADVLAVWLDELNDAPEPVQEVCDFHADRLTAPRGWTIEDRRSPRPTEDLLPSGRPPARVATVPATAPAPRSGRRKRAATASAEDVREADAPAGSLLARALRTTGRQHSVLTQDDDADESAASGDAGTDTEA
ncbi:MAG: DUF3499 family protein [Actinomycetes bacterium]